MLLEPFWEVLFLTGMKNNENNALHEISAMALEAVVCRAQTNTALSGPPD